MATRAVLRTATLLFATAGLACATVVAPVSPPSGAVFTSQSAPLDTNFDATPVGARSGTAVVHFIQDPIFTGMPLVTWGDASTRAAARAGGIQTVHYTDYDVLSVLGIYVRVTVKASGD